MEPYDTDAAGCLIPAESEQPCSSSRVLVRSCETELGRGTISLITSQKIVKNDFETIILSKTNDAVLL